MKRSKLLTIPRAATTMLPAPTHLRRLFVALVVLLTMTAQTAWATIGGTGTQSDPYIINSVDDWNSFADRVTGGESFEGKFVQLGDGFNSSSESPITKTAGYEDKDFKGVFDGRGKTMYVNLSASSTSDGQNVALFGSINGATIQNVKVEGNITSNNYNLGTFAGNVEGTSTIKHCWSNAAIVSTKGNDTDCGAMVGFIEDGTLNIIDCAFTGSIALNNSYNEGVGNEGGGFAGWISIYNSNSPQISNCLFAPTSLKAKQDTGGHGYVFVSGSLRAKLDNCYYNSVAKESVLKKEGTDASSMTNEALLAALGSNWEISGDKVVPLIDRFSATVSGIKDSYLYTGNAIDIDYTVTALDGTSLTKGTHFTETIKKDGSTVSNVMEKGNYTLTISGKSPYFGSLSFNFIVDDYIRVVNTTTVMNNCPYRVQRDVTISDRIVIQGDVTLTLEEGCTLTAQQGIKVTAGNTLTIDGTGSLTIQWGSYHSAGIGSGENEEYGHIIINGGTINTHGNSYGAGIGGGFYNPDNGNCCITINGGIINTSGGQDAAGIGGGSYGSAGKIVINGGQVTARTGGSGAGGIGKGYPSNDAKGLLTLDWTRESDFVDVDEYNISNINFVGKDFVLDEDNTITATTYNIAGKKIVPKLDNLVLNHATMNNLCSLYRYTGSEIALDYTIKSTDGVTTLVKGTDYSETIKKGDETVTMVKDKGEYTLTITGLGNYYTGTKSYTFSVADIDEDLTQDGNEYYVNLPSDGSTKTVNLGEGQTIKVYDSEGKNGSLVVSDGYLLLQAPDGYALEVWGKTDAMKYNAVANALTNSLAAYEGNTTDNEIITLQSNSDDIMFASGKNVMLIRLNVPKTYSYNNAAQYGLDLTVRVIQQQPYSITKGDALNGSISIADNKATALTNETITLEVNPADGYLLKRVIITDTDNGQAIKTIGEDFWYSGKNTVSFKMPNRNITLTPEFDNNMTTAAGWAININSEGTSECVIPENIQSFNLSFSAPRNGENSRYITVILNAHDGFYLQATGNVDFDPYGSDWSEFSIYDGSGTSSPSALLTNIQAINKGSNNEDVSIGTQTSSSNYMTFYLKEFSTHDSQFTGTIETQIKNYSITYDLTGGSVATENPTTYNYKTDDFTLINPTRDGYTFAGWTGTGLGAASTSVTVTKGNTGTRSYTATWTENVATLTEANPIAPLTAWSGQQTKVTFTRSGLTAGAYSTICLPYNFTASETCTFYKFDGVKKVGDDWVADISTTTGGTANTPYIFTTDATSVTFSNNAVVAASSYSDTNAKTTITDWTFQGTYSQISLPKTGEYDYGFAAGDGSTVAIGTFVHLKSGASAAPFRAYLKYTGSDDNWAKAPNRAGAANDAMPSRIIVRIVGADGGTTAIGTLDTRTGEIIPTDGWFDLNGRRLQGKPSVKGVYINNGNKVVIK